MARKPNFGNCTIYHIRAINTTQVLYVGSTTDFKKRRRAHKSDCKNGTSPIYMYIREQGGFELFEIVAVSVLQLADALELRMEEQLEMDKYTSILNMVNAYTSNEDRHEQQKVYKELNKATLTEKKKVYYQLNKATITEQNKVYKELNKDEIKATNKVYRQKNNEKLKEKDKTRYQKNKAAIKEKRKVRDQINKAAIKEIRQIYYQKNKEKLKESRTKSALTA